MVKDRFTIRVSGRFSSIIQTIYSLAEKENRSFNMTVLLLLEEAVKKRQTFGQAKKNESTGKSVQKSTNFINNLCDQFYDAYYNSRGVDYLKKHSGKDRSAMGSMLQEFKKKNPGVSSDETLRSFSMFFIAIMQIKDSWYYNNISLPIINSKLNEINQIIRNERKSKRVGDDEIKQIVDSAYDGR